MRKENEEREETEGASRPHVVSDHNVGTSVSVRVRRDGGDGRVLVHVFDTLFR